MAGDLVQGRIKMNSESKMEFNEVVVGMSGCETTDFRINNAEEDSKYNAQNRFLNSCFILKKFSEK